jgi:hypothetical protein
VIDRARGEKVARRQPGVAGADDDGRDLFDGDAFALFASFAAFALTRPRR